MQAIRVTYIPPTNDHGTRYRARCAAGAVTIPQCGEVGPSKNAAIAVGVLLRKLGWPADGWTVGTMADGSFVATHRSGEPVPVDAFVIEQCDPCMGRGFVWRQRGKTSVATECRRCNGTGETRV